MKSSPERRRAPAQPAVLEPVNIGVAATLTGVSAKMIRHYESLGMLPAPPRTASGYRRYNAEAVSTLQFIRRARDLGFSMGDIAQLLDLWRDRSRPSAAVKALALQHVAALQSRIEALEAMKRTLSGLAAQCHGDTRASCPILDDLAGAGDTAQAPASPPSCHWPRD